MFAEAINGGAEVLEVFGRGDASERQLVAGTGIPYRVVTEAVLGRLAGTETPRGPVAVLRIPPDEGPAAGRLIAAWGVADPGNCGTLIRTAAAFGYGFVTGPGSADPWSPKVLRAAAGSHFHVPVARVSDLAALTGHELIATLPAGGEPPGPIGSDAAVLIGSEPHGLPGDVVEVCDRAITIPMPGGTASLNAAVAGAIVAYLGTAGDGD